MLRAMALLTLLLLTACASPQQRCMSHMTNQLNTIDALVRETETNINRGFTYINEPTRNRIGINYCAGSGSYWGGGVRFCGSTYNDVRRRPVAIDQDAEQRKLNDLKEQQTRLRSAMIEAQAACTARYPG